MIMSGCNDGATQIAREAANRQAQQNTELATLNREVASGTHRLVEADAQARKEIIGVHHELQSERSRLDSGRDALEQDRRQIASERRTESALVALTQIVGLPLLLIVIVGFCWRALANTRSNASSEAELSQLLVHELLEPEPPPLLAGDQSGQKTLGRSKSTT
jgi:hypothetical protein